MRTTVIRRASVSRAVEYDPNFHGLLDQNIEFTLNVEELSKSHANLGLSVKMRYTRRDTGAEVGAVEADASVRIADVEVPVGEVDGKLGLRAESEEFNRLIEGALAEEVLLPLSILARSAKLPISLPIPIVLPRPNKKPLAATEKSQAKQ